MFTIMKKLIIFSMMLLCIIKVQAVPRWLSEMFGCTYSWNYAKSAVQVGQNGSMCTYEREMVGTSWLWGTCDPVNYTFTIPCNLNPNFAPLPPEYQGVQFYAIAAKMAELEALGFSIDTIWKNPIKLEESQTVLRQAISFRLELAGYEVNQSWFDLQHEPCPIPTPTQTVLLPQNYLFINADCLPYPVMYPNPTSGQFTVELKNYNDVTRIEIIRQSDFTMIYNKIGSFDLLNSINLTQPPGSYLLRVITRTGVIYKWFIVQ